MLAFIVSPAAAVLITIDGKVAIPDAFVVADPPDAMFPDERSRLMTAALSATGLPKVSSV